MSIFSGKLRRLGELTGSLTDKKPQLRVKITPLNDVPKVTLSSRGGFSGAWERAGRIFAGAARPLDILYRFIAARLRILVELKAKPGTGPAQEIQTNSAPSARVEAPAAARPGVEARVDSLPFASVRARLAGYRRAAAVYIANIFMARTTKLSAAPGVVARFRKVIKLGRVSKTVTAPSAIIESRFNQIPHGAEAEPATAPATETAIETAFTAKSEAPAVAAPAQAVNSQRITGVTVNAAPCPWFLAEYADGTLSLFQVFSGVQSGAFVEIDMEPQSAYWANAFVVGGTMELAFAATAAKNNNILEVG